MSRRKVREPKEETTTLGPAIRDGEHVFSVAHIFVSFNDTFIVSGMNVKVDGDESSPYAAMFAAQDVFQRCKRMLRPFRLIAPKEKTLEEGEGYKLAHYVLANLSF
ncbi:hypothetical protein J1N35_028760 [Gossypium stocksii]|uniref:Uncharacterized protein n=1 Tax=Gossypium stocksii TaxID=47602 RepID=A0A9D3ZSF8_9ROSI|nr:hypothetical protein J1N35_028760 [Gossypium stocksii]